MGGRSRSARRGAADSGAGTHEEAGGAGADAEVSTGRGAGVGECRWGGR